MGVNLLAAEIQDLLNECEQMRDHFSYKKDAVVKFMRRLLHKDVPEWLKLTDDVLENVESAVSVLNDLLNYDRLK